ncbi:MAG: engB [Acidimicrobiales bacterium]|nr:engB [Acidimicrobiales bacterium]
MSAPLRFQFVMSGDDVYRLPETRAEVAFMGRSNVGKSSLLNALANHKRLAHTSKTPGRTQLLNLFELGNGTTAVDLPGYGFAAVPGRTRGRWKQMINGYLLEREGLEMILVLVDGEIGPTQLDVQMLGWLQAHGLPHTVVASKQDKIKPSKRAVREAELAAGCNVEREAVVWVSAAKGTGIEKLRGLITGWLADGVAASSERRRPPTKAEARVAEEAAAAAPPADPIDDEDEWN